MQTLPEYRHAVHLQLPTLRKHGDYIYVGVKNRVYVHTYMTRYFKKIGMRFKYSILTLKVKNNTGMHAPYVVQVTRLEDV